MNCNRCLFDDTIAEIQDGICEYCRLHDELSTAHPPHKLGQALKKIKGKKYDCLIGISGGLDSSLLLYMAVWHWNLRPLVIHFDNGYNTPEAEANMKSLINKLGIDSIIYSTNSKEYHHLNLAFLKAGVPDADIPNDIAMTKFMYQTADHYGIKWILNGHDFRTEGSTPRGWTYMDAEYIRDVYDKCNPSPDRKLKNYPLFTFRDQIYYTIKGIKQIRPFYYLPDREKYEERMKSFIGWQDYGAKHAENVYTEFVGSYLLPNKFGIDKRLVYLSARVRSGTISKDEALLIMKVKSTFDLRRLGFDVSSYLDSPIQDRHIFKKYNFKKYRFLIWLMYRLKAVPKTFYIKYAK